VLVRLRSAPMPGAFEGTPRKPASERVMPFFDRGKSLGKLTTDIPEIASNVINGRDTPERATGIVRIVGSGNTFAGGVQRTEPRRGEGPLERGVRSVRYCS